MPVNDRMRIKMEQIARLRLSQKDVEIARQMNLSYGGLQRILADPGYKEIADVVLQKHLAGMDANNSARINTIRQDFRDKGLVEKSVTMLQAAAESALDAVKQRRDLRTALEAVKVAKSINDLDPDGILAARGGNGAGQRPGPPTDQPLPDQMMRNIANSADGTIAVMKTSPKDVNLVN